MKRTRRVRDEIEVLATRQQMLCDFAKLALGQHDRVAAAMLVKDAMSVDVDIRRQVNRLVPLISSVPGNETLRELKVGDMVIVSHICGCKEKWTDDHVVNLTTKHIILSRQRRFRISDGKEIGGYDYAYHPDQIVEDWGNPRLTARQHLERFNSVELMGRA